MKNKIIMKIYALLSILLLGTSSILFSQSEDEIKNMVGSRQYVFVAQYVIPVSGKSRFLTPEYNLSVLPDSLIAYLPYFGRAYQAPMDPSQGGIQFTSVHFEYKEQIAKKGGWNISIVTKDQSDNANLILYISVNGKATLQVSGTFRQPITFTGYIKENSKLQKAL